MRPVHVAVVAAVAVMCTRLGPVDGASCYDAYRVNHIRLASRFIKWSANKVDLQTVYNKVYWQRPSERLGCPLDLQEEDPAVFETAIHNCLCFKMRTTLVRWVRTTFDAELNALPLNTNIDAFYLHHARAQIRSWRRAIAFETKPFVEYFDRLVNQCFTQPLKTAAANYKVLTPTKAPTSHTTTPPPRTVKVVTAIPPATTTAADSATDSSGAENLFLYIYLVVLGCVVGATTALFIERLIGFIRVTRQNSQSERRGYVAIASPHNDSITGDRDSVTNDEEVDVLGTAGRPLLRTEAHSETIEREVTATEL